MLPITEHNNSRFTYDFLRAFRGKNLATVFPDDENGKGIDEIREQSSFRLDLLVDGFAQLHHPFRTFQNASSRLLISMFQRKQTVLLLIESSRGYGRGCLRGVADYCRIYGNWQVIHVERTMNEQLPSDIRNWKLDGIISRAEQSSISAEIDALGVPTVDLRGSFVPAHGASFDTDPAACAELALEHFWERGLRDVAFCGYGGVDFSDARGNAFAELAERKGCRCYSFASSADRRSRVSRELLAEGDDSDLVKWLKTLPAPCGVFACNDVRGRQVLRACAAAGIAVPEELALVGVDNDNDICDLVIPTMSSIEPDTHRIGFQGATYLAELMNGGEVASRTFVRPKRVVVRASSDFVAISDPETARILNYIGRNACDGLTVEMICEKFRLSRSSLERRLKRSLGRNAKAEIDRVRIERAKLLLRETDRKLLAVANHVAYSSAAKFAVAFKRITGVTPGEFRNQYQHGLASREAYETPDPDNPSPRRTVR